MTLTSVSRISLLLILAGSRLAAAADPAPTNEKPESDTAFITSHMSAVTEVRDQALARNPDPLGTLDAIRRIVALRRDAMAELNAKQPLTSLNGIETMDDYDGEAVLLLHDVTSAYVASDSTRPQAEQLAQFNSVLGGIPALGTSPVGFMVFGLTDIALMVTDTLWSDPQVSRAELAKATINLVHLATDRYAESLGEDHFVDPSFMKKSNRFRTNSVIMRMRCPKDDSIYKVADIKNRAATNGDILVTYYIQCQTCRTPRIVEFVQEFQSRLNRMADRQEGQGKKGETKRPGRGVEP